MCDSLFQNPADLNTILRTENEGIRDFLISIPSADLTFTGLNGPDVISPSFMGLLSLFPRFPDTTGVKIGSLLVVDTMGSFEWSETPIRVPVPGSVSIDRTLVFNEEVGICREIAYMPYGLPTPKSTMLEGLAVYDGTNFSGSVFRIQTAGYLDLPATAVAGDTMDRIANVVTTDSLPNTYSETNVVAPDTAALIAADGDHRPVVSGLNNTDPTLVVNSYRFPQETTGVEEGALLFRGANQDELIFTSGDLRDEIISLNPPEDLDFLRITPDHSTGTLNLTRSNNVAPADPFDPSTFIDASIIPLSQADFVSQTFRVETDLSHRFGAIIASFTGASDFLTHYVNFGQIGPNILPSTSPWESNPGDRPIGSRIYRSHDLLLHRGRRYYVERDVTPETNPVPGTTIREDGTDLGETPFTPYNCGIAAGEGDSAFTAPGQILYSTSSDIALLSPPPDDTGNYVLGLEQVEVDGFQRVQPAWLSETEVAAAGGLFPDEAILFDHDPDRSNLVEVAAGGANVVSNRFITAGVNQRALGALAGIPTDYIQNIIEVRADDGVVQYYNKPYTSGGYPFFPLNTSFPGLSNGTLRGVTAPNRIVAYIDSSGVFYVPRSTASSTAFGAWLLLNQSSNVGFGVANSSPLNQNSDFIRIYDANPYYSGYLGFLEKSDNSFWIYGNVAGLRGGSSSSSTQVTRTNIADVVKARSSGFSTFSSGFTRHTITAIALDSNGNLFFAGANLFGDGFSPNHLSEDFNRIFTAVQDPDNPGSTIAPNIIDFEFAYIVNRIAMIAILTSQNRVYVIFNATVVTDSFSRRYDLNWSGGNNTVGTVHLLDVENVVDIDISGTFVDDRLIDRAAVLRLLTPSAVYTTRNEYVVPNRVYSASSNRIDDIASRILTRIPLPRSAGWVRLIPGEGYGGVVDENGRIALHNPTTGCYAYV